MSTPDVAGRLRRLLTLRLNRTQAVVALLCAAVGFSLAVQIRQGETDALNALSQADLVRVLDEVTTRNDELATERDSLRVEVQELRSGVTSQEAARAAAEQQILVREIRAGVIPVRGPGIVVQVDDPDGVVRAQSLVTLIEELRNAGAEAIELNSVRIGTNSWVTSGERGLELDGLAIAEPYRVAAIGSPDNLKVALEMPGGVLASIRATGATTTVDTPEEVRIESVRPLPELRYAEVVESGD